MINIKEIQVGDLMSEFSLYQVLNIGANEVTFKHIKSGETVTLSNSYVETILVSADQFESEIEVGLQDKLWTAKQIADAEKKGDIVFNSVQVGDLKLKGIKTIWGEIGNHCFSVCFRKKGTELSDTAYKKLIATIVAEAVAKIEATKAAKKGVANTAAQVIEDLIQNPPSKFKEGELRELRGVKLSHESEDGFYYVADLDIEGDNKRLVNLNTIQYLVYKGVKYNVKY